MRPRLDPLPWLLALAFALLSLRGAATNNVVDTDAARHAMNGAYVHDMAAGGYWRHPIQYGNQYYSHLPALSLPYHPPLFPVLESVFFWIFGVNGLSARLAVAVAVAAGAVLFYRLIVETTGSAMVAACAVVTFYMWRIAIAVSHDVMLEMPSFAFLVAALYWIRRLDKHWSVAEGVLFALFASAAVWTKQHALFLGGIPVAAVFLTRRWSLLKRPALWISLGIFGATCVGLASLSVPMHNAGVSQLVYKLDSRWWDAVPIHHLIYYTSVLRSVVGTVPFLLILASPLWIWLLRGQVPGLWLYGSWALCAFTLLVVLGPYDDRYLLYVYPALLVIAYASLQRVCERWLSGTTRWIPAAACTVFCAAVGLAAPAPYLHGPAEAASKVMADQKVHRVLYCGSTDGNFVFAIRALEPSVRTVVLRGEPLLEKSASPAEFARKALAYGITDVVIEHTGRPQPCNAVSGELFPKAEIEENIVMRSSVPRFEGGTLDVYAIRPPEPVPAHPVEVYVPKMGAGVDLKF